MKPCGHDHGDSLICVDHTVWWVMPFPSCDVAVPDITPRQWRGNGSHRREAVVDEREEMTGRRDTSDVAAPAGTDAGFDRGDLRIVVRPGDGLDRRPAQQSRALLGDCPRWV